MTVDTITPSAVAVRDEPGSRIAQWVTTLDYGAQASATIVDTAVCPDSWWPLPPNVKLWQIPDKNPRVPLPDEPIESYRARRQVAIQTGAVILSAAESIGLDTLAAAVTGVFVVGGKPSLYAETMLTLMHQAGWRSRIVERSATRGAVAFWHKTEAEDTARVYAFTMDEAIAAGYVKGKGPNVGLNKYGKENTGGNEQYDLRPSVMLLARAITIGARLEDPGALKGMRSREELEDEIARDVVEVTATVTSAKVDTAAILNLPAPAPAAAPASSAAAAPQQDPAPPVANHVTISTPPATRPASAPASSPVANQETPQVAEAIDDRTWRRIGDTFGRLGVTGPGQMAKRKAAVGRIVDRDVAKWQDLTAVEGKTILDTLTAATPQALAELIAVDEPAPDPVAEQAAAEATYQADLEAAGELADRAEAEAIAQLDAAGEQYAPPPAGPVTDDPWEGQ